MNPIDKQESSTTSEIDDNLNTNQQNQHGSTPENHEPSQPQTATIKPVTKSNPLKKWGMLAVVAFVGILLFSIFSTTTVDTSQAATTALQQGYSQSLVAGTRLLNTDLTQPAQDHNVYLKAQGVVNEEKGNGTANLLVWDFAAVDGDYVQLFHNGVVISEVFMINHTPRVFAIDLDPAITNTIQVKGVKDGGGGITYGLQFKGNAGDLSFYNSAPINQVNTYTLYMQ